MNKPLSWSHSAIECFNNCPHWFYREKIVKDVERADSPELELGKRVHKAIEEHISLGRPLPDDVLAQFPAVQKRIDEIMALSGEKEVEVQMAVNRRLEPVEWFAPDAWGRAAADVIVRDGNKAIVVDWKTNKRAKEAGLQARILAFMTFIHYPEVEGVNTRFVFLRPDVMVQDHFVRHKDIRWLARTINQELEKIARCRNVDEWPKTPSGLCRFCPVDDCEHKAK